MPTNRRRRLAPRKTAYHRSERVGFYITGGSDFWFMDPSLGYPKARVVATRFRDEPGQEENRLDLEMVREAYLAEPDVYIELHVTGKYPGFYDRNQAKPGGRPFAWWEWDDRCPTDEDVAEICRWSGQADHYPGPPPEQWCQWLPYGYYRITLHDGRQLVEPDYLRLHGLLTDAEEAALTALPAWKDPFADLGRKAES